MKEKFGSEKAGLTLEDISQDPFTSDGDSGAGFSDVSYSSGAIDSPEVGLTLEDISADPFGPDQESAERSGSFDEVSLSVNNEPQSNSLYEQSGNDNVWFENESADFDDGGPESVTIDGDFDFSVLDGMLSNVEVLDLEGNASLNINSGFTQSVQGENFSVRIEGDATQQVSFEDSYTDQGITNIDGINYQTFTHEDTTIFIDADVSVVML